MTRRPTTHDRPASVLGIQGKLPALVAVVLLGTATTQAAAGQHAPTESPWLPLLDCWQLVEETGMLADHEDEQRAFADRVVVCLTPKTGTDEPSAVEVTTIADSERVLVETLDATGAPYAVSEGSCTGRRQDTWSAGSARLFTRVHLDCEDGGQRSVSGVGLMTNASTWLDIQLVEAGGQGLATVRRYIRASEAAIREAGATPPASGLRTQSREAARLISNSGFGITGVIEAHRETAPAVVEAMLVETNATFTLDASALLALDNAAVPGELIDLMVALSFPGAFVVDRPTVRASSSGGGGGGFVDHYGPYGFNRWYPYYASPFGYYYGWSPYNSLYYLGPSASYLILPRGGGGGGSGRFQERGQAFSGRGYARVGARESAPERQTPSRGYRGGGNRGSGSSGRASGGGASGGRAAPGGYSRGGSSGGRTAQPRSR